MLKLTLKKTRKNFKNFDVSCSNGRNVLWICLSTYAHGIFFICYLDVSRGQLWANDEKAASLT